FQDYYVGMWLASRIDANEPLGALLAAGRAEGGSLARGAGGGGGGRVSPPPRGGGGGGVEPPRVGGRFLRGRPGPVLRRPARGAMSRGDPPQAGGRTRQRSLRSGPRNAVRTDAGRARSSRQIPASGGESSAGTARRCRPLHQAPGRRRRLGSGPRVAAGAGG